jgi:hypothetical protein
MAKNSTPNVYDFRGEETMRYTRIYADENGESHFGDVDIPLQSVAFAPPAPPLDVSAPFAAQRALVASMPVGWDGGWHPAPCRQLCFLLSGELEVEVGDGKMRKLATGDVVLLEDLSGKGHVTRVTSPQAVRCAFVQLA